MNRALEVVRCYLGKLTYATPGPSYGKFKESFAGSFVRISLWFVPLSLQVTPSTKYATAIRLSANAIMIADFGSMGYRMQRQTGQVEITEIVRSGLCLDLDSFTFTA